MNYHLKIKRSLSLTLVFIMAFFTLLSGSAFGAEPSEPKKEKPFPSQPQRMGLMSLSMNPGNIGNDFVQVQVGSDGRFNAGLVGLNSENWYNIIFAWPSSPGTSFTTLRVDGQDLVYGNEPDGVFTQTPSNNDSNSINESVWKTGDISVKQVLQAGINPATGQADALQMRYIITNTGNAAHEVGLRMMLDTMVDGNDWAPFKVPEKGGVESINYEKDYVGEEVPDFWQVFNNFDNPDISAQYTMRGGNATVPDRFAITNWGSLVGTKWDYTVSPDRSTGDSAVGMWWNPETLAPGEQKIITTYFGRPGVGGEETLVLSGKKSLTYEEWSSVPFNLISYFTNTTGSALNDVRLELEAGSGIDLVDSESVITLGNVENSSTEQTTWKVQPNSAGKHALTVNAYAGESDEPIATANFEVDALEPVIPPNITLDGSTGTAADGIPMAGRLSPLTINAAFDDPQAVGVTLTAVDVDGKEYVAEMGSDNKINWTHTFVPSDQGLWGSPMTIKVVPRYEDGSTGEAQDFQIVLIDPSGYIYNSEKDEGWRLPGATVVLQYFDPLLETWVNMTDEAYPGRMSPITNPQVTGEDGRYAWDTAAGDYRVLVSRPGFENATSRVVTVPPEVTDLHVGMIPTDRQAPTIETSGAEDGGSYTDPVSITFTSADEEAGVRYTAYSVEGNPEVIVHGTNGSIPEITAVGEHTVVIKAVDHAGNEVIKEIKFEILNDEPICNCLEVATEAIEKSELAKTEMQGAMNKINANAQVVEIKDHLNKAKAANFEAKEKITQLKQLLETCDFSSVPTYMYEHLKAQAASAELQSNTVNKKLDKSLEFMDAQDLSKAKARLKEAQNSNSSSLASIKFIKGNLIIFAPAKDK